MVEQVKKGNRQNNTFGKKAWKYISDEFCKKTGLRWDKEQLKNRYAVLRRQYAIVKSLLDQTGFSWDEPTGTVLAKDEAWDEYIKEHPDAETIRGTGCPIYKQLCTIFSESGTNEDQDEGSAEYNEGTPNSVRCPEPLSVFHGESSSEAEEDGEHDKIPPTTPSITSTSRKRGRKGIDDVIANAILEMAAASKMRAAALQQRNERFSISDCVKALDEMDGVDELVYSTALNLFEYPNARETFLSLKVERRLSWLKSKLGIDPSASIG